MKNAQEQIRSIEGADSFGFTPRSLGMTIGQEVASIRSGRSSIGNTPWIADFNKHVIESTFKEFLNDRFDYNDPAKVREYANLLKQASQDANLKEEIAQYRLFELQNDVMAIPFALAAFQNVNLNPDELPLIIRPRSRNHQRFSVTSIGQDGGSTRQQWRGARDITHIDLDMIGTERIEYSVQDLEHGDVSELQNIDRELRYDMEMKIDELALTNMDAAAAASGLRALLSIHPSIDVNNIPDTNVLTLDNATGGYPAGDDGKLTLDKMKAILKHIVLFGSAGGADESFSISNIFVSPQNLSDPWDFVSLVSGWDSSTPNYIANPASTVPENVRQNIYSGGTFTTAWGHSWNWIPNSQISKGTLRITTSQPLGWYFTKTSMDKIIEWKAENSPDHYEKNIGEQAMQRAVKFYVPDLWQHRVVHVDLG